MDPASDQTQPIIIKAKAENASDIGDSELNQNFAGIESKYGGGDLAGDSEGKNYNPEKSHPYDRADKDYFANCHNPAEYRDKLINLLLCEPEAMSDFVFQTTSSDKKELGIENMKYSDFVSKIEGDKTFNDEIQEYTIRILGVADINIAEYEKKLYSEVGIAKIDESGDMTPENLKSVYINKDAAITAIIVSYNDIYSGEVVHWEFDKDNGNRIVDTEENVAVTTGRRVGKRIEPLRPLSQG